jgi:hypothetical protein
MGSHAGTIGTATFVAIGIVTAGMLLYAVATQRQTQREQQRGWELLAERLLFALLEERRQSKVARRERE